MLFGGAPVTTRPQRRSWCALPTYASAIPGASWIAVETEVCPVHLLLRLFRGFEWNRSFSVDYSQTKRKLQMCKRNLRKALEARVAFDTWGLTFVPL
jgi:hypothetical protein